MQGYEPGLQPQAEQSAVVKLNTNENPFPPSPKVIAAIKEALEIKAEAKRLHLYPDPLSRKLRCMIGEDYGLSAKHVLIGNGSDEILALVFRAVFAPQSEGGLLCPWPSYSLYPILAQGLGLKSQNICKVPLQRDWRIDFAALLQPLNDKGSNKARQTRKAEKAEESGLVKKVGEFRETAEGRPRLAVLANPNAPTGIAEALEKVLDFVKANPVLSLVDEAYAPFWGQSLGTHAGTEDYPRLMVCGTFSKAYSLAGQRIGWLLAHPDIICQLDKIRDSYNVSYLSQIAAYAAWQDKEELQKRLQTVRENRSYLLRQLSAMGFHSLPASANFVFTKPPPEKLDAAEYCRRLAENQILVRHFPKQGRVSEYVRITIASMEDLEKLLSCTQKCLL